MSCNIFESETLLVTVLKSVHSLYWLQCIIAIVKWFIAPLLLAFRSIKGKKYSPTTTRQYNRLYRFFCSIKQRCFLSWCFFALINHRWRGNFPTHKPASVTKNSVGSWTTSTGNVGAVVFTHVALIIRSRTKAVTRNGLYSQKNISPLFHTYIMKDCLTAYCAR